MRVLIIALLLCCATTLHAQRIQNDVIASSVGLGTDIGLQFVPGIKHEPVIRIATVGLIAVATKQDAFQFVWGALAGEVLGGIWKLAHTRKTGHE